jgi:hypothetical protein
VKDKNYGLTQKPNEGIKDKSPEWMEDLFYKLSSDKPKNKKSHPFEGIDDPILNPNKIGLDKEKK